jgi:hypothetical protein
LIWLSTETHRNVKLQEVTTSTVKVNITVWFKLLFDIDLMHLVQSFLAFILVRQSTIHEFNSSLVAILVFQKLADVRVHIYFVFIIQRNVRCLSYDPSLVK